MEKRKALRQASLQVTFTPLVEMIIWFLGDVPSICIQVSVGTEEHDYDVWTSKRPRERVKRQVPRVR